MRARSENNEFSVHAISGTHVVILGLDVKGYGPPDLSAALSRLALGSGGTSSHSDSERATGAETTAATAFVGFAIDRRDVVANESVSLNLGKPIQKCHFGDYTALPGRRYEYTVRRMVTARAPGSSAAEPAFAACGAPAVVDVTTEDPETGKHGVYFNRGVAGSRAYADRFGEFRKFHLAKKYGAPRWTSTINPRSIPDPEKSREALAWLSRGLGEALLRFVAQARGREWRLLATVYEFTHAETIRAFASAVERGVDVKIVRHCKGSYHARVRRSTIVKDERGHVVKDFVPDATTDAAQQAIDEVGFRSRGHAHAWQHDTFIERRHSAGIMHNKFIILVKNDKPVQVWTGSTNPTDSGIYGQSNVGHIVRDDGVAKQYLEYWNRLSKDTPGRKISLITEDGDGDKIEHEPMDELNEEQQPNLEGRVASPSVTVVFSPRVKLDMLQWYADQMAESKASVHYTAAFGIAQPIAAALRRGRSTDGPSADGGLRRSPRIARRDKNPETSGLLRYVLLDSKPSESSSKKKREGAAEKGKEYLDYYDLRGIQENRIAFGAHLPASSDDEGKDFPEESLTGLTTFVDYVHTKYMIIDALTDDPLVITGSANFSVASTDKNDENCLIIRGDKAVADIYFTEFMRLFDHFYSRDKFVAKKGQSWGKVVADESWLRPYFDVSSQLYRERLLLR